MSATLRPQLNAHHLQAARRPLHRACWHAGGPMRRARTGPARAPASTAVAVWAAELSAKTLWHMRRHDTGALSLPRGGHSGYWA
mmetsp:Transcript_82883/g.233230  ORF Transcript_82883/g.233230 Transcript_82883/m.233230 type:complete len:84 (-) Transcript_82883:873-1124(-)